MGRRFLDAMVCQCKCGPLILHLNGKVASVGAGKNVEAVLRIVDSGKETVVYGLDT